MNNIIEKFLKDKLYFKIAYLITSLIFVTFFVQYKTISSLSSKIMIVWAGLLILSIFIRNKFKFKTKAPYIFLAFILLRVISVFVTGINKEALVEIFIDFTMFVAIFDVDIRKEIIEKSLDKFIIISAFLLSIPSIPSLYFYKYQIWKDIKGTHYGYLNAKCFIGIFGNENALGISAALGIIFTLYIMYKFKSKIIYIVGILNILLQAFIISKCNATNAILILLVFIWGVIFLYFRNIIFRGIYLLLSLLGASGIVYYLIHTDKLVEFLHGRYNLWVTALRVIKENLIFGVGQHNFLIEMNKHAIGELYGITGDGTHNLFLQITILSGILVLIAFLIMIAYFFITIIIKNDKLENNRMRIQNIMIISLLMGLFACNFFETNLLYIISFISITFWSLLGYIYNLLEY